MAANAGAELLKRLNNKLGGYGPLPGARSSSASAGADTFRALGSWEGELCDPGGGVLAHLADPASPAFFQNLHRASQERILVALLRLEQSGEDLGPEMRGLVEKLVAIGGDKLSWAPRLTEVVRRKFGLADPAGRAEAGKDLLDVEADKICGLLDPVGSAPFSYGAAGGSPGDDSLTSSAAAPAASEKSLVQGMPGHIEDRIVRGMAQLGVLRSFPYSTLIAGTGEGDRVAANAYRGPVPGSVQVLLSDEAKLPEADYPFKLKHAVTFSDATVGVGGAGQSSRGPPMAGKKQNGGSSSSSGASSKGGASASGGHSHFKNAQDQKKLAIANKANELLQKMSRDADDASKKRPRDDGIAPPTSVAAGVADPAGPQAKKQAVSKNPPGWDDMNSEHLKRFSEMVAIIDSGKNADRKKKLKEKHKFRLQDFAAFPKHTMDASQGKDHFAIPFQIVKQEDGQKRLMALVLYYKGSKAGTFTEKSSSYKKRTK